MGWDWAGCSCVTDVLGMRCSGSSTDRQVIVGGVTGRQELCPLAEFVMVVAAAAHAPAALSCTQLRHLAPQGKNCLNERGSVRPKSNTEQSWPRCPPQTLHHLSVPSNSPTQHPQHSQRRRRHAQRQRQGQPDRAAQGEPSLGRCSPASCSMCPCSSAWPAVPWCASPGLLLQQLRRTSSASPCGTLPESLRQPRAQLQTSAASASQPGSQRSRVWRCLVSQTGCSSTAAT